MAGLAESAGGAPAGVVEPKVLPNRVFAGVACPAGVAENREAAAAPELGVELVPGAFPVLAPNRLDGVAVLAPNKVPPAAGVGVVEVLPKRLVVPVLLLAPPNKPPAGAPEEAAVFPAPPNSEGPEGGVLDAAALPPNKDCGAF